MNPNLLNNIYMIIFFIYWFKVLFYLYILCKEYYMYYTISLYWLMVLAIAQFS